MRGALGEEEEDLVHLRTEERCLTMAPVGDAAASTWEWREREMAMERKRRIERFIASRFGIERVMITKLVPK